jgi:hypothetical protein
VEQFYSSGFPPKDLPSLFPAKDVKAFVLKQGLARRANPSAPM